MKHQILLPDGSYMPKLGQGTWLMAEDDQKRPREIEGLRHGLELGIDMIDTAEMYADGKAELLAGHAMAGFDRSGVYLISKVYPKNANRSGIYSSLERSLRLLGTDYLDTYLLHWREDADLAEVAYCMEDLKEKGLIRRWGVSNFDVADMEDLWKVPDGNKCCVNQVLYNLGSRGIEFDLLQWQRERNIPFIAYGPVGQAGAMVTQDGVSKEQLMTDQNVREVARRKGISVVQLLLAFVLRLPDFAAIPKAVSFNHIEENLAAQSIVLTDEDLEQLSASFPAPERKILMEKY
ncbi:aldo/keto reductase [bacterium 210820-DFI.6.37]|nr:aldo/keto reductase [bacterium 210820-DFI.6.37]